MSRAVMCGRRRLWWGMWWLLALPQSFVQAEDALTNADILALTRAGLAPAIIVVKIQSSETDFDTSVEQLLALTEKGVAPEVLKAMAEADSESADAMDVFRDCPHCPEMVVVPAGSFRMGSVRGSDDEKPVHGVTIARPFALGRYEVTVGEFAHFVQSSGHQMGSNHWRDPKNAPSPRHPVALVSWEDALAYARWLSFETGESYRLPSEAEWEYAARAGTTTEYFFGDTVTKSQANYGKEWTKGEPILTVPVGSYPANAWGLHDMHGNGREWVQDCWNESYRGAPGDGSAWMSGDCGRRVSRGGSWSHAARYLRSASRYGENNATSRYYQVGFRLVRELRGGTL